MKISDPILKVENVSVAKTGGQVLQDISFTLGQNEHLAITGESGSGKTTLGLALSGRSFYKGEISFAQGLNNIVWVEQQHHFKNLSNTTDLYYQQRFNSYDSEQTETVEEILKAFDGEIENVLRLMKIEYLRTKPLIQLSNGENKKLQIARSLLEGPSVLIMDQPFIGLDKETRNYLHGLINKLANAGILIILITTPDEIPQCIQKILLLENGKMKVFTEQKSFAEKYFLREKRLGRHLINENELQKLISNTRVVNFSSAIRMNNVNVQYGEKKILQQINWEVMNRERWLLSGPNGAGKSTLLNLITADNPQAYANEIYLFDRRRGTGESIWDIKKKIGYLSPELHLFFDQGSTCFETIASGLFDTIGLFRQIHDNDIETVNNWMSLMGLEKLRDKRLYELSIGQQRTVLLTRALVKDPPLLILDEPCQGLDKEKQSELLDLINTVCLMGNKTMVFVTHYENDKPACIDHYINLKEGRIVEKGLLAQ